MTQGELFGSIPKFPMDTMMLVDRITEVSHDGGNYGRGHLVGEFDIDPDLWFFAVHFKDDPVMPGCLGLDALWQLTGFYMAWLGIVGKSRALGVEQVRFRDEVPPTSRLVTYRIDIRRVVLRPIPTAIADGTMLVDGREAYLCKKLMMGFVAGEDGQRG